MQVSGLILSDICVLMSVACLTGCCWQNRPLAYRVMREWRVEYSCTLLLPASSEPQRLKALVSVRVKPRQSLVQTESKHLSSCTLVWQAVAREDEEEEGEEKKNWKKGGGQSTMSVHVSTQPRHWRYLRPFQPPDWSCECFLLLNMGSVFVFRDLDEDIKITFLTWLFGSLTMMDYNYFQPFTFS